MIQNNDQLAGAKQLMMIASLSGNEKVFDYYYALVCEYEERGIDVG